MKRILLLVLVICASAIIYGQGAVTKLAKDYDKNNPQMFWYNLGKDHPQIKAMKKAIAARKPAMIMTAQEIGGFSIRNEARYAANQSERYQNVINNLYQITQIRNVYKGVEFFIVNKDENNACMYPDGTCIIYSGLIENTPIHEEIIAVVAHEIAHYVLWHTINDCWRTAKAVRRNQAWASVGTGLAAGAYAYSQINAAQYGVAQSNQAQQQTYNNIANTGIRIREEIGLRTDVYTRLRYMRETEEEADEAAFWFLENIGIDPIHYINLLKRWDRETPEYLRQSKKDKKYSTHPDMPTRIQKIEKLRNKYHK